MDRRNFLRVAGVAAGCAACPSRAARAASRPGGESQHALLIDTTACVGCRTCEASCAEANSLPAPEPNDDVAFATLRTTTTTQRTVVQRYDTPAGEVFVKRQCMHCLSPACATACLTRAMYKTSNGPVVWREAHCMGCRYCMVSCPFDIPKFEYDSPVPSISKCQMCFQRTSKGEPPACVANCPMEAITFGPRAELLHAARQRIIESPDDYVDYIYGEHEVGGTSVLYLSKVPFQEIGFRTDLGTVAYPELTREFLYAVPVMLMLGPALLLGLSRATDRNKQASERQEGDNERGHR